MKKFFTVIPLQLRGQLASYHYTAVGNSRLEMEGETSFPILTALSGYAQPGEEVRVIAVMQDSPACENNRNSLLRETAALCESRGIALPRGVEVVRVPLGQEASAHAQAFHQLLSYVDDDDELFACMTYGTKPQSMALLMAVRYAYRIKRNASIRCVVYGNVVRPGADRSGWYGEVYDMTALLQMDELVRVLGEQGEEHPEALIGQLLAL